MENKSNIILIVIVILVAILGIYVAYDKGIIFNNEDNNKLDSNQENNIQENDTKENNVSISLVDPATENFVSCPVSIDSSKYLQKQNDGTYVANLTLENVGAAIQEYNRCYLGQYFDGQINYKVSAKYGNNNMNFNVLTSTYYAITANINNDIITSPKFYIFNNEYLVVTQGSTNTTGPAINDGIYIYDGTGTNVFKLQDITLDIYDENNNLKNGLKYKKICEGASFYEDCETITYGEIKYDATNKKFIVEEENLKYTN